MLKSRVSFVAVVCAVVLLVCVPEAAAYEHYTQRVPNGGNVPGEEAIGHRIVGGGPVNAFGQDFKKARYAWTKKLCMKDSDGDGQTNGQELGDPCCEFVSGKKEKVRWTEGVSHPGSAKSKSDPALWEGFVCGEDGVVEVKRFNVGAPSLQASVMLSAAALLVLVLPNLTGVSSGMGESEVALLHVRLGPIRIASLEIRSAMGAAPSRVSFVAAICAVVSLLCVPDAAAYKLFQLKLPNGGNVPGVEAIGHENVGGGPNNDFGLDFIEAMFKWTKTFCEKDSDGDGQTNGQELGDPCCEFVHRKNEKVQWTEGVSHPGDPALKSDPALWEGIVCGAEDAETVEPKAAEAEGEAEAEAVEPEAKTTRPEGEEPKEETNKDVKGETVMEAAVQGEARAELNAGAPALHASVMLSAAALTVMVIYVVVMRMGRRSSRNLPIFRQQRRGPM